MAIRADTARNAYLRLRRRLKPPGSSLRPLQTYSGHSATIWSIAFVPNSEHVVSASEDRTIRVWSLAECRGVGRVIKRGSSAEVVAVSEDGNLLAIGGVDGKVEIWDTKSLQKVVEAKEGHSSWVTSLSFSSDSTRIASGSDDCSVSVWSTSTGERL
ncbi:hypothetical protein HYDPIDRAFT_89257, partial [Hydnomerulius pinastri MD-312]